MPATTASTPTPSWSASSPGSRSPRTATTTVTAKLTETLSRFDLDFALPATSVTVNGTPATFTSVDGPEYSNNRDLVVTPAQGLPAGSPMTVVVAYRARPADVLINGF